MSALSLDAYFDRIGYGGQPGPDLRTLQELHLLHPQAIPFDGLSPFLDELWVPAAFLLSFLRRHLARANRRYRAISALLAASSPC